MLVIIGVLKYNNTEIFIIVPTIKLANEAGAFQHIYF